eukprot:Gregarina_sp_Poly_1__4851@NODE_2582_length_1949_cov_4_419235_g1639_i0_p2_GENE_NODE_2582_length_1949_cov_4_419235_g1639_i0NODE_2582_length_1949_cov_4_419235_g1639_i0_p2_ORF_typecomplete_len209_score24_80_NODE_2582_length_1949_cov_4_419235_g1639_i010871713
MRRQVNAGFFLRSRHISQPSGFYLLETLLPNPLLRNLPVDFVREDSAAILSQLLEKSSPAHRHNFHPWNHLKHKVVMPPAISQTKASSETFSEIFWQHYRAWLGLDLSESKSFLVDPEILEALDSWVPGMKSGPSEWSSFLLALSVENYLHSKKQRGFLRRHFAVFIKQRRFIKVLKQSYKKKGNYFSDGVSFRNFLYQAAALTCLQK